MKFPGALCVSRTICSGPFPLSLASWPVIVSIKVLSQCSSGQPRPSCIPLQTLPTLHCIQSPVGMVQLQSVVEWGSVSVMRPPSRRSTSEKDHSLKLICKCLQSYRLIFLKYITLYSVFFPPGCINCSSWMTASFFFLFLFCDRSS